MAEVAGTEKLDEYMSDDDFEAAMNQAISEGPTTEEVAEAESDGEIVDTEALEEPEENISSEESNADTDEESSEDEEEVELEDEEDTEENHSDDAETGEEEVTDESTEPTTNESDEQDEAEETETDTVDESTDAKAEETTVVPKDKTFIVKADGLDYEFTEAEMTTMASRGMNYTKKSQAMAKHRPAISVIESEGITVEDLNLLTEMKKGNAEAFTSMAKQSKIDVLDLDTDNEKQYTPKNYGKSETELNIEEVTAQISQDKEYVITQDVIGRQWDDASKDAMIDEPQLIGLLHDDVKSGVYDSVAPMATKLKLFGSGNKSDIEYYKEAGQMYYADLRAKQQIEHEQNQANEVKREKINKVKTTQSKKKATNNASNSRKNATLPKGRSGKKSVIDYLETDTMSDDEFSTFMDKEIHKRQD